MISSAFRVRGCHPLRPRFPACSATDRIACCRRSYNPGRCRRQPRFGLLRVRSPLLAQSFLLSFPPGTKMFQFPGFALGNRQVAGSLPPGFPIRTSAGHRAFAPHRGFSQLITSFIASESHRHPPCALVRFPFIFTAPPSHARGDRSPGRRERRRCIHKTRSIFPILLSVKSLLFLVLRSHHVNDLFKSGE